LLPSEFTGSFVAQFLVSCSTYTLTLAYTLLPAATNKLAGIQKAPMQTPNPLFIAISVGLIYATVLYWAPGASMNPIMTVHDYYVNPELRTRAGLFMFGGICIAQIMGTMCGYALTYALLISSLKHFIADPTTIAAGTAVLFGVSFPPSWVPNSVAILAIILASAVFVFGLHGVVNGMKREDGRAFPRCLAIAILIMVNLFTMGGLGLGAGFNPVQPLAGAIFVTLAGWPSEVWTHQGGFVWISICAPFVGVALAIGACHIYDKAIMHGKATSALTVLEPVGLQTIKE